MTAAELIKFADVFFNRRPAEPESKVTIQELVKRKRSLVRVGKKLYWVEVREAEIT